MSESSTAVQWMAVGNFFRALQVVNTLEDPATAALLRQLASLLPVVTVRGPTHLQERISEVPPSQTKDFRTVALLSRTLRDVWCLLFPAGSGTGLHVFNLQWAAAISLVGPECRALMEDSQGRTTDGLLGPLIWSLVQRLVIVDALATVVHYITTEIDVLRAVWGALTAHRAIEEMAAAAASLDNASFAMLTGHDLHVAIPCQQTAALARIFWGLFARMSLLFEAALEPSQALEAEELPSASTMEIPQPRPNHRESTGFFSSLFKKIRPSSSDLSSVADADQRRDSLTGTVPSVSFPLLNMCGCGDLAAAIHSAVTRSDYPAAFFIASNSQSRLGRRFWHHQQFNLFTREDDEGSARGGMAAWSMCTILPSWTGIKTAAGHLTRIGFNLTSDADESVPGGTFRSFHNERSVYYVQRSGPDVDGGRLYFGLIVDAVPLSEAQRKPQSEILHRSAKVAESDRDHAMGRLKAVQDAWSMAAAVNAARCVGSSSGKP
jgi:hypothetical protein